MRRWRVIGGLLIVGSLGSGTCAVAMVSEGTTTSAAAGQPAYVPGQLLVKLKPGATPDVLAPLNQRFGVTAADPLFQPTPDPRTTLNTLKRELTLLTPEHRRWHWWADRAASDTQDYSARIARERAELESRIAAQEALIARLDRRQARADTSARPSSPGTTYRLTVPETTDLQAMARVYATHPAVEYAEPNRVITVQMVPNDPYYASKGSWGQSFDDLYGVKLIASESAWDTTQGDGVLVAVVDTGADATHPDLAANLWTNGAEIPGNGVDDDRNGYVDDVHGWDFVNRDADPADGHGHGTHVAGTIAAVGNNRLGVIGVAPKAKILPVKGLSDWGSGDDAGLAAAIRYAAAQGADVMNNSWGGWGRSQTLEEAVAGALRQGCVVVVAAGNSNDDANNYQPANIAGVITVAATDAQDRKAWFSNKGPRVDVAAPGVDIVSLRASGTTMGTVVGERYVVASGTSMASPHTAGVAALVLGRYPSLTPGEVRERLKTTTDLWPPPSDPAEAIGTGRVNAAQAVGGVAGPRATIEPGAIHEAAQGANGNGILESQEMATFTVSAKNIGTEPVSVTAVLTTADKAVAEIPVARCALGTIAPGHSADNAAAPFSIRLGTIQYETPVTFTLTTTLEAGGQVKTQTVAVPATFGVLRLPLRTVERPVVVSDRFVVWRDFRNYATSGSDLYGYEPATQREFPITTDLGTQMSPAISGNDVVWLGYDAQWHADVYYADLSVSPPAVRQITQDPDEQQLAVAIGGRKIAWMERPADQWGDFTICVYDLDDPTPRKQVIERLSSWVNGPAISGTRVLWQGWDFRDWTPIVSVRELTTGTTQTIRPSRPVAGGFQLDGPHVVWYAYDASWSRTDIFLYDLVRNTERQLTSAADAAYRLTPAINGSRVAWEEPVPFRSLSYMQVRLFDFKTNEAFEVTKTKDVAAYGPQVSRQLLTWGRDDGVYIAALPSTNAAPVLSPVGGQTVPEGQTLTVRVTASDPDGDPVTLTADKLPAGASFAMEANKPAPPPASGIEQPLANGARWLGHDGGDVAWLAQSFTLPGSGTRQVQRLELSIWPEVWGTPSGGLTVELQTDAGGAPSGIAVAAHAATRLTAPQRGAWNPATFASAVDLAAGTPYWIVLTYAGSLKGGDCYGLATGLGNPYPDGRLLRRYPTSRWHPIDQDDLAFKVVLEAEHEERFDRGAEQPSGLSEVTGVLTWTPTYTQAGRYTVELVATDAQGEASRQAVPITVQDVNRAPVLSPLDPTYTVLVGKKVEYVVTATDPDGDRLRYTAAGLPAGAVLHPETGYFAWTPTAAQVGTVSVTVKVSDGALTSSQTVSIIVRSSESASGIEQPLANGARWLGHDGGDVAWLAQSFTLPGSGTRQVQRLELSIWPEVWGTPSGGLTVELQTDAGGAPSGTAVAQALLNPPQRGAWNPVPFAAPVDLAAGTPYWIVLTYAAPPKAGDCYGLAIGLNNPYPDGRLLRRYPTSRWHPIEQDDLAFKVVTQ